MHTQSVTVACAMQWDRQRNVHITAVSTPLPWHCHCPSKTLSVQLIEKEDIF